ncbi:MAG: recombinase family protein, partial [Planctomycetaceae bacterium]|nr:recombinase family protein [Planctomycetaceae bacterium]
MFQWYASEQISPSQIASRLNKSGVSAVFGEGWNKQKVKQTLSNPAYIGMPAYNKRASGRFWEYVDGEMQPVKRTRGKAKSGRTRAKSDYVFPKRPVFEPIVPVELFNEVQRKLEESSKRYSEKVPSPRSPRTASFWLKNFLFCSGCLKVMRAWNANPNRPSKYRSYYCGTYGTYGKDNPTGCRSNRVKAELLEGIVDRYLCETHQHISKLIQMQSEKEIDTLSFLESGVETQFEALRELIRKRNRFIRAVEESEGDLENRIASELIGPDDVVDGSVPVLCEGKIYEFLFQERKPILEAELAKLDAEHNELLERSLNLPAEAKLAQQKVAERLLGLEQRIERLRSDLHCVSHDIAQIVVELQRRK